MVAYKETEEKIENAAISLFAEKGYKGTSTRRIAKEAGVSELTIYRYYKTKEELFRQALVNRTPDEWLKDIEPNPSTPIEQQLTLLFERLYESLTDRQDLIRIFYREGAEYPDIVTLAKQVPPKIWAPMEEYICKTAPDLPETMSKKFALQIFSTYLGISLLSVTFGPNFALTSMAEFHGSMARTYACAIREAGCKS